MRVQIASAVLIAMVAASAPAFAQAPPRAPFDPDVVLGGKDVVWVPTPPSLVEAMLDLAHVTPSDVVMDLGSGDGRAIIAAAHRGAHAIGIEYNPDLVAVSTEKAEQAGVGDLATFVEGDMFAADISRATVLTLFLLPDILQRMRPTFQAMPAGSRIALNTFPIPGWTPDETVTLPGCQHWCTALLYVVPAEASGRWTSSRGELTLTQSYQMLRGTLERDGRRTPVTGRLRGATLTLTVGGETLTGTVGADRIDGAAFSARRPTPR